MAIRVMAGRGAVGHPDGEPGRTVALVDLGMDTIVPVERPSGTEPIADLALRAIEQAVRNGDRVCPFGTYRVAVAFGPDADAVSPKTLGERLARAVRLSGVLDGEMLDPSRPAIPETGGGASQPRGSAVPSLSTVIVDRLLGRPGVVGGPHPGADETAPSPVPGHSRRVTGALWHRTVVRCSTGGFARYGTRHNDVLPGNRGRVLVVSPCRASGGAPGLSAIAAAAMAERLGYQVATVALSGDDELVLDVRGAPAELVVLVIEGERDVTGHLATWVSSNWHISSQLAARFASLGIGVLAVGAGAGYGALASCVAQGAAAVLHLDDMHALLSRSAEDPTLDNSRGALMEGDEIPQPLETLVLLTASERRVLFYLTVGRSAQEIADDLVVSVTTVRSHIRSILRKLGVRSQLAAVAIANSQDSNGPNRLPPRSVPVGRPEDLAQPETVAG